MTRKLSFTKSGYEVSLDVYPELDRNGNLPVTGTIDGQPFTGTYTTIGQRRVIKFAAPVVVGGQRVGGVEPPDEARGQLDIASTEARRRQEAAAAAYREAVPPELSVWIGRDSSRVYVQPRGIEIPRNLPVGTRNRVVHSIEQSLNGAPDVVALLDRLGQRVESRDAAYAWLVPTTALLSALNMETDRAEKRGDRPIVRVRRCWECGRMTVVSVAPGLERVAVERLLDQLHTGELTADALPFRCVETESYHCGC